VLKIPIGSRDLWQKGKPYLYLIALKIKGNISTEFIR
jgi:hypothetical protein